MGRTLYWDTFSGISGDMALGALIDLGADFAELTRQLNTLSMADEFTLHAEKTARNGITGTDVTVEVHGEHHEHDCDRHHNHHHQGARNYRDILRILEESPLSDSVKARAKRMFERVAKAEAAVHGKPIDEVHFHEVGAVDSIVDTIGVCIALELLNVDRIACAPLNLGGGTVRCAHGILPVPAPATARILEGIPCYGSDARFGELVTPTGAAIAAEAEHFGPMPIMAIERTGYGFGKRDTGGLNAVRAMLAVEEEGKYEPVTLLTANIDDMTGEDLAYAAALLREIGALDVWFTPILMKKGRPGQMLSCLCRREEAEAFQGRILRETSTWGVRILELSRAVLPRESREIETPYGKVHVKCGGGKAKPEHEDCAAIAKREGLPIANIKNVLYS